jgi:hypothetical protein
MMDAGGRASDDEVLELLRGALRREDPPPDEVVTAAKEAWTWRTIDAELAALTYDSALDEEALAGVRGVATARTLSFGDAQLLIEIELTAAGGGDDLLRLEGQVAPPTAGAIVVERVDGHPALPLSTDDLGRFHADRLDPGVVRLRLDHDGRTLVTDWFAI